jgi:hypothetical protein
MGGARFVVLEGHINSVFEHRACHMSGARFMVPNDMLIMYREWEPAT